MLNVYVCEDNPKQLKNIVDMVSGTISIENFDMKIALYTTNPQEILAALAESSQTGLYFLDVDLKSNINGLTLAKEIRKYDPRGFIVFITTHAELSYLTFLYKVEAMDYIIKDTPNAIKERVHQCICDAYEKYTALTNKTHHNISFRIGDKHVFIKVDDIVYIEPSPNIHKIILHTVDGMTEINVTMKELESQLDGRFYRCHKSCIINKEYISVIDSKNHVVIMTNGDECPASTRLIKGLL